MIFDCSSFEAEPTMVPVVEGPKVGPTVGAAATLAAIAGLRLAAPGSQGRRALRRGPCPERGEFLSKDSSLFCFSLSSYLLFLCRLFASRKQKAATAGLAPLKVVKRGALSTPGPTRPRSPPPSVREEEGRPQEGQIKGPRKRHWSPKQRGMRSRGPRNPRLTLLRRRSWPLGPLIWPGTSTWGRRSRARS